MDVTLYIPYKAGPIVKTAIHSYGEGRKQLAFHTKGLIESFKGVDEAATDVLQTRIVALRLKNGWHSAPKGFRKDKTISKQFNATMIVPNTATQLGQEAEAKLSAVIAPTFHSLLGGAEDTIQINPRSIQPMLAGYTYLNGGEPWVFIPRNMKNPSEPIFVPADGERQTLGQFYDAFEVTIVDELKAFAQASAATDGALEA